MSVKEQLIALLDVLPAYKMGYVLAYVQGIMTDEEVDDLICQQMLEDYANDPDPDKYQTYTLEECKKEWGLIDVPNSDSETSEEVH